MEISLPKELYSGSYMTYAKGISAIKADTCKDIDFDELIIIMRTYYWHIEAAGFQDIYDLSVEVYKILSECVKKSVLETDDYDYGFVRSFIIAFDKGNYTGNTSNMIYSLEKLKNTIQQHISNDDLQKTEDLIGIFQQMQHTEQECYYLLRDIIREDHFDNLFKVIKTFAPEYLDFVLHTLDHFKGNQKLIEFYQEMLSTVDSGTYAEEIENYLSRVH